MTNYNIHQYTDSNLAQYGYLIRSGAEAAVIDPPRDIGPILEILHRDGLTLKAIVETHPHADFVSGHLELHAQTGALIHVSRLLGAEYDHAGFDNGDTLSVGHVALEALNTPGHSPDSISILLRDEQGAEQALFSGDTLFVGDVGRPDLREKAGNIQAKREELAGMMFDTVQTILKKLPDHVVVYPAHGAGTLCGRTLRDAPSTTIGEEKTSNPAFRDMTRDAFIAMLTQGQPFIPQYFPFDVSVNRRGAPALRESLESIPRVDSIPEEILVIDTRGADQFNKGHIRGALHIAESGLRFETWVGTIVAPDEPFIVIAQDEEVLKRVLSRIAKIGYEQNIRGAHAGDIGKEQTHELDLQELLKNAAHYTIIDVRQPYETESNPVFAHAINIPLDTLRASVSSIPADKPVAVHCAGGYRSMIAESILSSQLSVPVYDIGEHVRSIS
jgi:glyoxylase-like metal-dependent hydrolase (beta-lactamase superfamily II)/rhodanese-related sulfurtransferase